MSILLFDQVFTSLQTSAGSLSITVAFTLFVPIVLFLLARIPPFFGFILITPVLLAFGAAGLLGGTWVVVGVYIVFGLMWAFVLRQGMNLQ